jgi:hypothetical protein
VLALKRVWLRLEPRGVAFSHRSWIEAWGLWESRGVEKVRSRAPETSPSKEAVVLVLDNCYVSCPAGPRRGLPAAERAERKDFSENLLLLSGMDVGDTRNRLNGAA